MYQRSVSSPYQLQWGCKVCSYDRWAIELTLFCRRFWLALLTVGTEYVHMILKNIAFMRHERVGPLKDLGFDLIPLLDEQWHWLSEALSFVLGASSVAVFFLPFCLKNPRYFVVTVGARWCLVLSITTLLRCISFLVTSVPGPHPHCLPDAPDYNPPETWAQVWDSSSFNFGLGCGDLIFSGHTLLLLSFYLAIHDNLRKQMLLPQDCRDRKLAARYKKCYNLFIYGINLPSLAVVILLIVSSRKHYSIDVLLATIVTPLVHHSSYALMTDNIDDPVCYCCYQKKHVFVEDSDDEEMNSYNVAAAAAAVSVNGSGSGKGNGIERESSGIKLLVGRSGATAGTSNAVMGGLGQDAAGMEMGGGGSPTTVRRK